MNPRDIGSAEAPFRLRGEIEGRERVFDLEIGELRVGSSSKSDLKLAIPGISRQHALLVVRREGLVVEDRGSRNGTFVDGRRIQRAAVVDGAELRFGPVALRLQAQTGDDATIAIPLGPETQGSSKLYQRLESRFGDHRSG